MSRSVPIGPAEVVLDRLLTSDESAALAQQLLNPPEPVRSRCWHTGAGLTTIGKPLYRSRQDLSRYAGQARATNALLYSTYRPLYDRVADYFEDRYALPADFVDELAVPGFHVMTYAAGRAEPGGWHFDQLAHQAPYFADRIDELDGILNFTLPLAVPSGGTGMDIAEESTDTTRTVHVPYEPGVVLFNECELFHRIGASICLRPGEVRLTMQGHGVRHRGRVLLFW